MQLILVFIIFLLANLVESVSLADDKGLRQIESSDKKKIRRSIHNTGETLSAGGIEIGTYGAYVGVTDSLMLGAMTYIYGLFSESLVDKFLYEVRAKYEFPDTHWRTGFSLGCSQGCRTVLDVGNRDKSTYGTAEVNTGGYYGNHSISLGFEVVDVGYQVTSLTPMKITERRIRRYFNFDYSMYFKDSHLAYIGLKGVDTAYVGYTWNFEYIRIGFILTVSFAPIIPYFAFRKD